MDSFYPLLPCASFGRGQESWADLEEEEEEERDCRVRRWEEERWVRREGDKKGKEGGKKGRAKERRNRERIGGERRKGRGRITKRKKGKGEAVVKGGEEKEGGTRREGNRT